MVCDASLLLFSSSAVSDSVTPWTIACQASLSMGILQARVPGWVVISFSRGSSPGIEPAPPHQQADSLPLSHLGNQYYIYTYICLYIVKVKVLMAQWCLTLCNPMERGSSVMEFSRQEHWSG